MMNRPASSSRCWKRFAPSSNPSVTPPLASTVDMQQDAFLQAIFAAPDDDTPRLVYADWLDEHRDAPRAEFIRLQIELSRLSEDDERHWELKDRESALLEKHRAKWLGGIGKVVSDPQFERGFV